MYAINQLLLGLDADTAQHAARHFAEQGFNDVQPGAVLRREHKLKSLRMKTEPALRLFRNVCRVIVEQEANAGLRRIALVEFAQQGDEIRTGMMVADDLCDPPGVEIETGQQRYRSQAFIFIVPEMSGKLPRRRRAVWCGGSQRLNARLLVVGNGHHRRLLQRAFQQLGVDDVNLFINMQDYRHPGLELRITALHVIANLVRANLPLCENPVQSGAAQLDQTWVTRFRATLPHMPLQQREGPKLLRVAQFFRFLAGTMLNPGNSVIWNTADLTWTRQFPECGFPAELKELAHAQRYRMAIHAVAASHRRVA